MQSIAWVLIVRFLHLLLPCLEQDQLFFFSPFFCLASSGPEPGLCWSIYSAGGYTQRQSDYGRCVLGFGRGDIVGIYVDTRKVRCWLVVEYFPV